MSDIKIGALCWNQYADWPALLAAGRRADELGYDTLWTWDHLYPIVGNHEGPILEGWLVLAAWASTTRSIRIGLMVGANTFRQPSLTAKMATTLDHLSSGRAILGIGAAWNEREHEAFGIPFGDGFPERLRWLSEALPVMRGMLANDRPSSFGPHYAVSDVINNPPPMQARLPILIGGGGEQVTLKLVAKYGDANNISGGIDTIRRKEAVLLRHCETVGRNPAEIERTTNIGTVIIRDSRTEARRIYEQTRIANGDAASEENPPIGTVDDVAGIVAPLVEFGYRHLVADYPFPYDEESMTRFALDVRPRLA